MNMGDQSPIPRSDAVASENITDVSELVYQMNQVIKLLHDQKSTATYIHQFGVWLLGIGVILSFYYNYVLLEPILWTLFGVLFSYVALYPPKVKVVKSLVFVLGPREKLIDQDSLDTTGVDDFEDLSTFQIFLHSIIRYIRIVFDVVVFILIPSPGSAASSLYFSLLYRLMFAHFYMKIILNYFPTTNRVLMRVFLSVSAVIITFLFLNGLRRSALSTKKRRIRAAMQKKLTSPNRTWTSSLFRAQDKLETIFGWFRNILARLILPQSHLIAAIIVMLAATIVLSTVGVWTVYAFSDELVYLYRNIANVVRIINTYLSGFSAYTHYLDKAYRAASEWVTGMVMADSASAKTRALYEFISFLSVNQRDLASSGEAVSALPLSLSVSIAASDLISSTCFGNTTFPFTFPGICNLSVVNSRSVMNLTNATRAIITTMNQDLESFMIDPYSFVNGFWELVDYYSEELATGGTISKGGDYLLIGLNYLKELIVQSGSISLTAIGSGVSIFTFLFDSALQALVYITALFLLLQSNVGFYHYTAVLLHFVDPSTMLYRSVHRALRAILISSIKMAIFHAGMTWLMFSFLNFPLVCIPTIVAFILGLVPVVSPVIVCAIPLPIWAYSTEQNIVAVIVLAICFVVWWSVGSAIYAEIPDSSVWMTTFSVGLGISLFGARGVIIGPTIATIPFALYGLGSQYISGESGGFVGTRFGSSPRGTRKVIRESMTHGRRKERMGSGDSIGLGGGSKIFSYSRDGGLKLTGASRGVSISPRNRRRRQQRNANMQSATSSGFGSSPSAGGGVGDCAMSIDELIRGTGESGNAEIDRQQLFDYIMSTPKTARHHGQRRSTGGRVSDDA